MTEFVLKAKKIPRVVFIAAAALLLLAFPRASAAGAADGIRLCLNTVVPSLYPFMCLSSYLVLSGSCARAAGFLAKPTRLIFGLDGAAGAVILAGMLCGYPVGVRMAAQTARRGEMSVRDARAAVLFCVNAGPAFIIGAIGGELLGSRPAGRLLLASSLLASLTVGLFTRLVPVRGRDSEASVKKISPPSQRGAVLTDAVADATRAMLSVCSWVVLFGCISSLIGLLSQSAAGAVLPLRCAAEVTSGCREAIRAGLPLPVIAALLGWSGLCVQYQLMPYVTELGISVPIFMSFRALTGALCAAYCGALTNIFRPDTEVFLGTSAPAFQATSFSAAASAGLLLMGAILMLRTGGETD